VLTGEQLKFSGGFALGGRSTVLIRRNLLARRARTLPIATKGGFNYTKQHIIIILLAYYYYYYSNTLLS